MSDCSTYTMCTVKYVNVYSNIIIVIIIINIIIALLLLTSIFNRSPPSLSVKSRFHHITHSASALVLFMLTVPTSLFIYDFHFLSYPAHAVHRSCEISPLTISFVAVLPVWLAP